jgi:hypothetical protein
MGERELPFAREALEGPLEPKRISVRLAALGCEKAERSAPTRVAGPAPRVMLGKARFHVARDPDVQGVVSAEGDVDEPGSHAWRRG